MEDIYPVLTNSIGKNIVEKSFSSLIEDKKISIQTLSRKERELIEISEREKWPSSWHVPTGYLVSIKAIVSDPSGNIYEYDNDGHKIEKGSSILYIPEFPYFKISKNYTVKWQIVNTGADARAHNDMRGEIAPSNNDKSNRFETIKYEGSHYVQCFVIIDSKCYAKSRIFIINV